MRALMITAGTLMFEQQSVRWESARVCRRLVLEACRRADEKIPRK